MKLYEVQQLLPPRSGNTYEMKLYGDPKSNTATLYVVINGLSFTVRLGFRDPYKTTTEVCRNISAIHVPNDTPITGIEVELYAPVEGHTSVWQVNIEYDTGEVDVEFLNPTGKKTGLIATTHAEDIQDLLKQTPKDKSTDSVQLRNFLNNLNK